MASASEMRNTMTPAGPALLAGRSGTGCAGHGKEHMMATLHVEQYFGPRNIFKTKEKPMLKAGDKVYPLTMTDCVAAAWAIILPLLGFWFAGKLVMDSLSTVTTTPPAAFEVLR